MMKLRDVLDVIVIFNFSKIPRFDNIALNNYFMILQTWRYTYITLKALIRFYHNIRFRGKSGSK